MRIAETVTFGGSGGGPGGGSGGGGGLDRAAGLRGDVAALLARGDAGVLPLWRGKPLFGAGGAPCFVPPGHPLLEGAGPAAFLGLEAGAPRLAADVSAWAPEEVAPSVGAFHDPSEQVHPAAPEGAVFAELRARMTALDARGAELAATARALLEWHRIHGFCAACGAPTRAAQAGWQRECDACGRHHFPRTDPVAIMLVTHGERALLGRSRGWPEGMYSLLAGFVEPGETVEAAVRRETFEEAGVRVGAVRYLASQPWPFPASLMLGCHGIAEGTELSLDPAEIEDALWLSREELADVFAGVHGAVRAPREGAIAGFMLRAWLADRLD